MKKNLETLLVTARARLVPMVVAFRQLPTRDQRLLALMMAALAVALLWVLVAAPAMRYAESARQQLDAARADLGWMQANAARARHASAVGALQPGQTLLSAVNASAQQANLNLQRFEPDGDRRVRVTLENAVFTDVMRWVVDLERRYGVRVDSFNADVQAQPGLANIRLTLATSS